MNHLKAEAAARGIALTREMLEQLALYREMLLDWNTRLNLTAITQPEEVAIKHFLDSLLPLGLWELPQGASLVDVGTGAGFPGVVLKIARPDLRLTLLDSLQKRTAFLKALSQSLGQQNEILHGRAEELARNPAFREAYDVATARAVAELPALCEYCLPLVKVGGAFLALKGPAGPQELQAALPAIEQLGGAPQAPLPYRLPDGSERVLCVVEKRSQTPTLFPRKSHKITKAPLR